MQRAVEHDSENCSNYAMCAVNPSCISKSFDDVALREVVDTILMLTNSLLQIVNFNVEVSSRLSSYVLRANLWFQRDNNMSVLESLSPSKL